MSDDILGLGSDAGGDDPFAGASLKTGKKAEAPAATPPPADPPPADPPAADPPITKATTKKLLSPKEKVMRLMKRRAGVDELPPLEHLMREKVGTTTAIKDVAIFLGEPKSEVLQDLAGEFSARNTINLSAEIAQPRVVEVGAQILQAGRVFQPIMVARLPDGRLQCTSGRHRLAFLALAYGSDAEIPVVVEKMTENEARDAVVYANDCRRTKAMEKVEHAALKAVDGDIEADQDELYTKLATTKPKAKKYCVFSVLDRGLPASLDFPVSVSSSRKDGGLTTISNISNYFGAACLWTKEMPRKDFDESIKSAVGWLNAFVEEAQKVEGFEPKQHLASMTLQAVGKWFQAYSSTNKAPADTDIAKLAATIVGMGGIGRQKSDTTYMAIGKAMK